MPLPSLPEIVLRIDEAVRDPRKNVAHIASLVQLDAALAARLLKVANSALYHNGRSVDDCRQAILRIGLHTTRNLVSCLVMHNVFDIDHPLLRSRVRALWQHSCHVGAIAYVLAEVTPGLHADKALLAGLLHDVGILAILKLAQDEPALLEDPALLDAVIDELRGEFGSAVLTAWRFGEDLCAVPRLAQAWDRQQSGTLDYVDVIIVAQAHSYIGKPQMRTIPPLDRIPAFAKFPISRLGPDAGVELLQQAQSRINGVLRMLSR